MNIKDFKDHRTHCIQRIKERYDINLSVCEYDIFIKNFNGVFKKTDQKTIGYSLIEEVKVWGLYIHELKCIATVYPPIIETEVTELIRACFSTPVRQLAFFVYETYAKERDVISEIKFDNKKDAAIYYFKETLFPSLHIDNFVYGKVS